MSDTPADNKKEIPGRGEELARPFFSGTTIYTDVLNLPILH